MGNTKLLTVMLSWNRPELVRKTIESYFNTISVPYRFVVVDNGSDLETVNCLQLLSAKYGFEVLFLEENIGGRAYNIILERECDYDFVHFSENDIQYLPGWDAELLTKMELFPKVGQISPFSPFPQMEIGEIWAIKPHKFVSKENYSLCIAKQNVGGTSVVRKELINAGLRWSNLKENGIKFPNDGLFSRQVKKFGWDVAWNDKYVAINWGHNISEFQKDPDYYVKNYLSKSWLLIAGFKKRLNSAGYDLVQHEGKYQIIPLNQSNSD